MQTILHKKFKNKMSITEIQDSLAQLNLTFSCCNQPLIRNSYGKYVCQDCSSIWKHENGKWSENILYCCGNEIKCNYTAKKLAAFYCPDCNCPRQVCGDCLVMFHIKHNIYHHICKKCFDKQLEEN